MISLLGAAIAAFIVTPESLEEGSLKAGFSGALRGCEEWVLNPASWTEGTGLFLKKVGLGNRIGLVESVSSASLPPEQLRAGNHYWRINSTENAGYVLVVSDQLPMCHITGGGGTDLKPMIEATLNNKDFQSRWKTSDTSSEGDMVSTTYKNREEPAFTMIITRPSEVGGRTDRVQIMATAVVSFED